MKGAARYLLGKQSNNLSSLPKRPGTAKKVIIFETDGQPDELCQVRVDHRSTTRGDVGADRNFYDNGNGEEGLRQLRRRSPQCGEGHRHHASWSSASAMRTTRRARSRSHPGARSGTARAPWVRDYLAQGCVAPVPSGRAEQGRQRLLDDRRASAENEDGDYYFCAAVGSELGPIFATAVVAVTESIRLIELP